MPADLLDNYVANTYKGVLHANGEELPENQKVQVYDGAGNATALKIGTDGADITSLSAQGLTASDFKYPDVAGTRYSVLCQTSDAAENGVNIIELKTLSDIFCLSETGPTYTRESESEVPIIQTECGVITTVNGVPVTNITEAAGGANINTTGTYLISSIKTEGGVVTNLQLAATVPASNPNLIINAQGIINQRQISSGGGVGQDWNPKGFFLDRWKSVGRTARSWSYNANNNVATIIAAAGISQIIERANIVPGQFTLSWLGNASATVKENNVVKGTKAGANNTVNTLSVNLGGGGNVEIIFSNGTVSLPKFEKGSIRTEFDYRDFASELRLCQRYFCKTYGYSGSPNVGSNDGAITIHTAEPINPTLHNAGWRFPVELRAKTHAWAFSAAGAINKFTFNDGSTKTRPCDISEWSTSGISKLRNTGSALSSGTFRAIQVHYIADAEL